VDETYRPAPHPPYAVEVTCDGITVRYEAPTAEELLRLRRMHESDRDSRGECPPSAFIRTESGRPVPPDPNGGS
jgi:hypothetical protein